MENTFTYCGQEWRIEQVESFSESGLTALANELVKNGKDAAIYYASKILKSGKPSTQCGSFYRFSASGNFVRVS